MITAPREKAPATPSRNISTAARESRTIYVWLGRLEWIVVILAAMLSTAMHFRFATQVGGLWRDEVNSVNLATLPTLSEVWRLLEFDSFPVLFPALLRTWSALFGVENDSAFRGLGLLIGLGVLGALWLNARACGARLPVLSFALIGLNPMVIRYGDSTRAYGLGILLILLTLWSYWCLVERPGVPSARRICLASALALLSVHCLYYNSVLLFAISMGAVAVAIRHRAWRTGVIILGIGAVTAGSLLIYAPMLTRKEDWTFLVNYPATFPWLWQRVGEVLGSPHPSSIWVWVGLVVVALGGVVVAGARAWRSRSSEPLPSAVLFAAVTMVIGVAGYAGFLRMLNYYTQPWYYVALVAFTGCVLDIILGTWPVEPSGNPVALALRVTRPLVAITFFGLVVPLAWAEMPTRHTNVDLIAAQIQSLSGEGDIVLVPRWECAITFCRYFHGKAGVVSIPPIDDHRFHRYDLLLEQMKTPDANQPVLDRMEKALRSGHRVFFADTLPFEASDAPLPNLFPPYKDPQGRWHKAPYDAVWKLQTGRFLRAHSTKVGGIAVALPPGSEVQQFENLGPGVVEGWQ